MMMQRWRRFKSDLRTGWTRMRQGAAEAVDRSLEEIELLKLKSRLYKVEAQIKELHRTAGERGAQLIERGEGRVGDDKEMQRLFEQVDQLKQEEARIRFEMEQVKE